MNLSGIAVIAAPQNADAVARQLATLPGVQVAQIDATSGRIVLVQEAQDVAAEIDSFRTIQCTPGVIAADLVCHYFGEQPLPDPDLSVVLARLESDIDPIPRSQCSPAHNELNTREMP